MAGRPKKRRTFFELGEILNSSEAQELIGICPPYLTKMAEEGVLPKDSWFKVGSHYKYVKRKLAEHFGIIEPDLYEKVLINREIMKKEGVKFEKLYNVIAEIATSVTQKGGG